MNNMDSITPQEFAKQMGAYPNAPYNPIPVGGYMDEGFDWVLGAESEQADLAESKFGADSDYDKVWRSRPEYFGGHDDFDNMIATRKQVVYGQFTYTQHTHIKNYEDSSHGYFQDYREYQNECHFEIPIEEFLKRNKKYITIERDIYDRKDAEYFGGFDDFDNMIDTGNQVVYGKFTYTQHTHIKKYKDSPYEDYREHHNECSFDMPIEEFLKRNKKYITIERNIYDRKDAETFEAVGKRKMCADCKDAEGHGCGCGGKSAESYSQVMGPTIEANEGGLHSPSSFNITWEDGTGQSSASMPPNEIHFGADDYTDEQLLKVARWDIDNHIDNGTFYVLGEEPQAFQDGELDGENFYTIVTLYAQHHEDEDKAEKILWNMFREEYPQYLGDEYDAESFGAEYDFQKMTPSPYTPFDQIGNELQQQRMESGPMLEPTNANYSAEAMPISDDGELLAVYDDMGTNKGFIEMEDDLEDDSIEIEISDDEMNEIAEVRLDSEVVGNPSPSSPLEEVPAKVPSPAEPSNQNFSAEKKTDYVTMILGTAALVVGSGMLAKSQGWIGKEAKAADTDDLPSIDPTVNDGLVASPSTGDLLPADYEEMVVESTGYAVPIIPVSLDGSFMGSRFQALPTDRLVESNEPGIGAHTDVAMYRDTMYREPEQSMVQAPSLNAEHEYSIIDKIMAFFKGKKSGEKEVKESQGVGQAPYFGYGFERKNPQLRVVKE